MGLIEAAAGEAATLATGGPAGWALKHWKMIIGALGFVVLGVMLMIAKGDARHWEKIAGRNQDLLVEERQKHATTLESLHQSLIQIDESNARIRAGATRLEADRREAAASSARQAERWRGTQATIAALEADAHRTDRKPCTISPAAQAALEDL